MINNNNNTNNAINTNTPGNNSDALLIGNMISPFSLIVQYDNTSQSVKIPCTKTTFNEIKNKFTSSENIYKVNI